MTDGRSARETGPTGRVPRDAAGDDCWEVGTGPIFVATSLSALAPAIVTGLDRLGVPASVLPWTTPLGAPELAPKSVLVVVSSDAPPTTILSLSTRAIRTVVLTPAPREAEQRQYMLHGASAYLPLDIDLRPLANTLQTLL